MRRCRQRYLFRGHRTRQRLQNKSSDHEGRQQTTYESVQDHGLNIAWNRRSGKINGFTSTPTKFPTSKTVQNQMVNSISAEPGEIAQHGRALPV